MEEMNTMEMQVLTCVYVCVGGGHARCAGPPDGGDEYDRDAGHHGHDTPARHRPLHDGPLGAVSTHR